jgi:hypothetical protein
MVIASCVTRSMQMRRKLLVGVGACVRVCVRRQFRRLEHCVRVAAERLLLCVNLLATIQ